MSGPCTVLIAAPHLLPALTRRALSTGDEVVAFAEVDALRALEQIIARRPQRVALERAFATTPRGAALINRIKADPSLTHCELRVVTQDAEQSVTLDVPAAAPVAAAAAPIDAEGTRRLPRQPLNEVVEITIDGNPATLVDLTSLGAQVVSATVLRPNQRVRVAVADSTATIRTSGSIAWASFEIPPGSGPRYRAGIEFVQPDTAAIDALLKRHS